MEANHFSLRGYLTPSLLRALSLKISNLVSFLACLTFTLILIISHLKNKVKLAQFDTLYCEVMVSAGGRVPLHGSYMRSGKWLITGSNGDEEVKHLSKQLVLISQGRPCDSCINMSIVWVLTGLHYYPQRGLYLFSIVHLIVCLLNGKTELGNESGKGPFNFRIAPNRWANPECVSQLSKLTSLNIFFPQV